MNTAEHGNIAHRFLRVMTNKQQVDCGEPAAADVSGCALCASPGTLVYRNIRDRFFNVPGQWNVLACDECHLLWLTPRPLPTETPKLYTEYYTHGSRIKRSLARRLNTLAKRSVLGSRFGYTNLSADSLLGRLCWRCVGTLPPIMSRAERDVLYLHGQRRGRVLDIGCGNGSFLATMKAVGWEVYGFEPDPKAAQVTRARLGCDVRTGSIMEADYPPEFFDAITLNHVIEHVHDPVLMLRRCHDLLAKTGVLVLATPNGASLGHRLLRDAWRELDPPRHFFVFKPPALVRCVELAGFAVERVIASGRNARQIWIASRQIQTTGRMNTQRAGYRLRAEALLFSVAESTVQLLSRTLTGEEIAVVARKVEPAPETGRRSISEMTV